MIDVTDEVERLIVLQEDSDREMAHMEADEILCDVLERLGYTELVQEYNGIAKWYA